MQWCIQGTLAVAHAPFESKKKLMVYNLQSESAKAIFKCKEWQKCIRNTEIHTAPVFTCLNMPLWCCWTTDRARGFVHKLCSAFWSLL